MTELEEAELRMVKAALSCDNRSRAYEGYAKRTMERSLAATRKRHGASHCSLVEHAGNRISE